MSRPSRSWRALLPSIAVLALVLLAALAPTAGADGNNAKITLRIRNHTDSTLRLVPSGSSNCWSNENFDVEAYRTVQPDSSAGIRSSAQITDPLKCLTADRNRGLAIEFLDGQTWRNPLLESDAKKLTPGVDQMTLDYNLNPDRFRLLGLFERWLPIFPARAGAAGPGGAFCITGPFETSKDLSYPIHGRVLALNVESDPNKCWAQPETVDINKPRPQSMRPRIPAGASAPRITLGAPASGTIYSLTGIARTACEWAAPSPRWNDRACADLTNQGRWDLDNVSAEVRSIEPETNANPVVGSKLLAGPFEKKNATNEPGELTYGYKWTQGESNAVETTSGWERGFDIKGTAEVGLKEIFKLGLEVTGTFMWHGDRTEKSETKSEVEQSLDDKTVAGAHGTTYVYVFQPQAQMAINFSGDLLAGKPNTAEPLKTPMARDLRMSGARVQPCYGYLVGPGDRQSFLAMGKRFLDQGYSGQTPGLDAAKKTMLRSLAGFNGAVATKKGDDRCPGWPAGYPAAAAFRGQAGIQLQAGGPAEAPWAKGLGPIQICSFFKPEGEAKPSEGGGKVNPCLGARGVARTDESPSGDLEGGSGSDLLIATAGGQTDTLRAGAGALDVLQGAAGRQRMFGGAGKDYISGDGGPDLLVGGAGPDTLLGGRGNDVLRDDRGANDLEGGPGDDRLRSAGSASGGMLGGPGDDTLTLSGKGGVAMVGGPGNDTYRLLDGAEAANAVELRGGGIDTMVSDSDFVLPPEIERGIAGPDGVAITAGPWGQELIGGRGDDTLDGGPGGDRLIGRGGNDRLLIGDEGFDVASGGPGADRFIPIASPAQVAAGEDFRPKVPPSASLIEDFRPAQGDLLVLRKSSFGPRVEALRKRMVIREGADPLVHGRRPQLLFARHGSLLRFDPDGIGPAVAQVVAILRGVEHLPAAAIRVRG